MNHTSDMYTHHAPPFDSPQRHQSSLPRNSFDKEPTQFNESSSIECQIEGTNGYEILQLMIDKPTKQEVTLLDVKSAYFSYGKSPGVFHLKTADESRNPEEYHWTVITQEMVPLVHHGDPAWPLNRMSSSNRPEEFTNQNPLEASPDLILKVKLITPRKIKRYIKKGEPGYKKPKPTYIKKGQPGYKRPKYYYKRKTTGKEEAETEEHEDKD
ncbi:hypothetical protein PROFUN_09907 [Planoprotostelium fungivorum]|uniref:Uncharacterized protein n=1 Tax=Planoprotostelium fungivorum TaxID=1890364 RepID=A0A2P6NGJ3_9EUKA|nr:hypothetical protein PROFUN_09907 [Planoprotostelium fungivorum]